MATKTLVILFCVCQTLLDVISAGLHEPRLDELLKRTSSLKDSERHLASLASKLEEIQTSFLESSVQQRLPKGYRTDVIVGPDGGTLYSPSLAKVLPSESISCRWELTAPRGHLITLNFTHFNLDYGQPSPSYAFNRVRVFTRISFDFAVEEAVFSEEPHLVTSKGNKMVVEYEANRLFHGIGFVAIFYSKCGDTRLARAEERSLFSHPLYGFEKYPANESCEWEVDGQGKDVFFSLAAIDVGTRNDQKGNDQKGNDSQDMSLVDELRESFCENDYLEISTHHGGDWKLMGRACGQQVPESLVKLTARRIRVRFESGADHTASGFHANYRLARSFDDYER